jgi:hypothetical protein
MLKNDSDRRLLLWGSLPFLLILFAFFHNFAYLHWLAFNLP